MGYISYMERKAQQGLLKRAMEASWIAVTCPGMVFGPLLIMLETAVESGKAHRQDVDIFIDTWLQAWQRIRHLSDRNLIRNRVYYAVRPNEDLSRILAEFEQELGSIRSASQLSPSETVSRIKATMSDTVSKLLEYNEWAKWAGSLIEFNSLKYEDKAVRRAHKYWASTVRALVNS